MVIRPHPLLSDGMLGMLCGDALGVPYEFHAASVLPTLENIEMVPPKHFPRSYAHVRPGTWSDDGAQALCLLASLRESNRWDPADFAERLLEWYHHGYMAVGRYVFDIGNQTAAALQRLESGTAWNKSGLAGERNNGNGSLMRCLPLPLVCDCSDEELVELAHEQSMVTHAHPRSMACCALYVLWVRREIEGHPASWQHAQHDLLGIYRHAPELLKELETQILPSESATPHGTGYVVDSLFSSLAACQRSSYSDIVRTAIAFGNDTDTTACIAGGVAGIRYRQESIPQHWLNLLTLTPEIQRLIS